MNAIIVFFLWLAIKFAVWCRYRVTVTGLDEIAKLYGKKGLLFLPNHPALIDPVIMSSVLWRRFKPRALVTQKQINESALKYFWRRIRLLPLPDMGVTGLAGRDAVKEQIQCCIDALKGGDNLLFYPAGRIYRSKRESLRGNSGVAQILKEAPDTKVVLVRTTGLWGSEFGRGKGYQIPFGKCLARHIKHIFLGGIIFMPRRPVHIEFVAKPEDLPAPENKDILNRYLENFYNHAMRPNTYVPYTWFEHGGIRTIPEPESYNTSEDTTNIPDDIRKKVKDHLRELTGKRFIRDTDTLGTDLGLDSLIVAELQQWLHNEFGHEMPSPEKLRTVASLIIATTGESAASEPLYPVPGTWFYDNDADLTVTDASSVPLSFLKNAKANPKRPVWADQNTGVFTNRKMVLAVMLLRPIIAALPGERIGILMPATVASTLLYLACQFAGKVPVMINWTVGARNMKHCAETSGVQHILTAKVLIERLKGIGTIFDGVEEYFLYLEDLKSGITTWGKIKALIMSYLSWRSLWKAPIPETAAILFTSGSENMPKTVPLTHRNILEDLKASVCDMTLRQDDCLLGMLPPFHSFGLLLNTMLTCVSNIRVVYHANPTEYAMLARLIAAYKVSFTCATPTFVSGILRNGTPAQLETVRLVVCGAEKCSQATLDLMHEKAVNAKLFEGYGITECGPIISMNKPEHVKFGTVGRLLACAEGVVVNEDMTQRMPSNSTGMLLVRGANIFSGYMNYDGPSPFVEFEGKSWYRTGDLVQMDDEGFITFKGRLKRFVKIGGEMISLPALEEVLLNAYHHPDPHHKGPTLAVESPGDDADPCLTLFTSIPLSRDEVNQFLLAQGFSPLYSIKNVVEMETLPTLGSGKTDYRTLKNYQI